MPYSWNPAMGGIIRGIKERCKLQRVGAESCRRQMAFVLVSGDLKACPIGSLTAARRCVTEWLWLIRYLRQLRRICFCRCLSVCLSVCLLATLRKNLQTDLYENFQGRWQWNFGGDPYGYRDCFRIRRYWEIRKVVNGHKSAADTDSLDRDVPWRRYALFQCF